MAKITNGDRSILLSGGLAPRSLHPGPIAVAIAAALLGVAAAPARAGTTYFWDSTNAYPSGDPLTLNLGDTLDVDNALGNRYLSAQALTNGGTINWNTNDALYFQSGSTITNNGTFNALASTTLLESSGNNPTTPAGFANYGLFSNSSAGAVNINSTQYFVFTNESGGVISNTAGSVTNFAGNGSATFEDGSMFQGAGTSNITGGATFNGAFSVASGTTLQFLGGTITGAGSAQTPAGATLTGTLVWDQGTISGTWVNPSGSTWNAISSGNNKVMVGGTLNNAGLVEWSGTDNLYMQSHSVINNTGVFDVSGASVITENAGNSSGPPTANFNNNGGTVSTSGTGTLTFSTTCCVAFNDTGGTINAAGGAITFVGLNNNFTNTTFEGAGLVKVNGDATFSQNIYSVPGGTAASNGLQLVGGTLTGNGAVIAPGSAVTWFQGTPTGTWTVASGGELDAVTSGNNKVMVGAQITNNGTINWASTDSLFFQSGSTITNNGTFNVTASTTFLQNAGNNTTTPAQLVNNGVLQLNQTGATLAINADSYFQLVNNGVVQSLAGTIQLPGNFKNTGTLAGTATLSTAGTTLINAGHVTPGTFSAPGMLASVGNLTINGNYAGSGGTVDFAFNSGNPGAFSTLAITGTANHGGDTLDVLCLSTCSIAAGDYLVETTGGVTGLYNATVQFTGFAAGTTAADFQIAYSGNNVYLDVLQNVSGTPVPLPGSLYLMLGGIGGLALLGQRRRVVRAG